MSFRDIIILVLGCGGWIGMMVLFHLNRKKKHKMIAFGLFMNALLNNLEHKGVNVKQEIEEADKIASSQIKKGGM